VGREHPHPVTGDPGFSWHRAGTITEAATGPGSIIQSSIGTPANFEVIVPEGSRLMHYQWAAGAPRDWLVSESAIRLRRHHCFAPAGRRV
jgi:hypothetical protein